MKTSTALFLKPSNMRVSATLHGLLGMLLSSGVSHAQVSATCADLQWPTGLGIQSAQRVAAALKAGTLSANVLAQAIDVANVLPLKDSCSAAVKRFVLNGATA
jgi:hypothetical protein